MDDITEEEKIIICAREAASEIVSVIVIASQMDEGSKGRLVTVLEEFTAALERMQGR